MQGTYETVGYKIDYKGIEAGDNEFRLITRQVIFKYKKEAEEYLNKLKKVYKTLGLKEHSYNIKITPIRARII